ncbi:hypothetical protein ACOMHN_056414 [Nucella lapillus]
MEDSSHVPGHLWRGSFSPTSRLDYHLCVISHLNVSLPPPQPKYIMAHNLKAVDRCALKQDLTTRLSSLTSSTP